MQLYCLVILEWCKFKESISLVLTVLLLLWCVCCPTQISSSVNASTISCHQPGSPSLSLLYHIGLGGGGKAFQHVELWERVFLDIRLENHKVLTFRLWRMPALSRVLFVRVKDEVFSRLKTLVSVARSRYLWRRLHRGCLLLNWYFLIRVKNKVYISVP